MISTSINHPTGELTIRGLNVEDAARLRDGLAAVILASASGYGEWQDRASRAESSNRALHKSLAESSRSCDEWRNRALKAERGLQESEFKINQYERQGGTVNMERSWKGKYRNALAEANQRLIDAGLDPVRIRNRDTTATVVAVGNGIATHIGVDFDRGQEEKRDGQKEAHTEDGR